MGFTLHCVVSVYQGPEVSTIERPYVALFKPLMPWKKTQGIALCILESISNVCMPHGYGCKGKVRSSGKDYNMNRRFKKKIGKRAQPRVNKVVNTYWWKIGKNTPGEEQPQAQIV